MKKLTLCLCTLGIILSIVLIAYLAAAPDFSNFDEDTPDPTYFVAAEGVKLRLYPDDYRKRYSTPVPTLIIDIVAPTGKATKADTPTPGVRFDYSGLSKASELNNYYAEGFRTEADQIEIVGIALPGVYGGKGDFSLSDDILTIQYLNNAIDALIKELNPEHLVVSGHSATGKLVSGLLTKRDDMNCTVISHAYFDNDNLMSKYGWTHHYTGNKNPYNFADHVNQIIKDPNREVHILSSEKDMNVPHEEAMKLNEVLRERGEIVYLWNITYEGLPDHGSTSYALKYAAGCARKVSAP